MKVIEADRCMYLRTVRGEIQIPSLGNSSLAMRSSPQERLLKAISRTSRLSSIGTGAAAPVAISRARTGEILHHASR